MGQCRRNRADREVSPLEADVNSAPLNSRVSKLTKLKRPIISGSLALLCFGSAVLGASCGPKPVTTTTPTTTTQTTTPTTPTISYDPNFLSRINYFRSHGEADIADKLVSLYATEPGVADSISVMERTHPGFGQLVMQQPWYLDGLSNSEKIFIKYGLGDSSQGNNQQGIAGYQGEQIDQLLKNIIVNQQYVLDTVQLSDGIKQIVEIYDRNNDAISKENIDLSMKLVKASVLDIEKLQGAKYPLDAIIVFARNNLNITDSTAQNGTINMGFSSVALNKGSALDVLEETAHAIEMSRKGGSVEAKSNWSCCRKGSPIA